MTSDELRCLKAIERQILWHACWMIHAANHLREKGDVKVGGHQASCASLASIMTALYFHVLRPEDRVAVKPHAGPLFHGMQYLMGNQTLDKLKSFRSFGGIQSYPSRTKDTDDVDFSTGSVGLGVPVTAFASLVQDYLAAKPWAHRMPLGRMVALAGDAELDEGSIYECLQEAWKHELRNVWWIIDYNRQSLDGMIREGLWQRIEAIFKGFGWDVVTLKYGALQRAAFAEPGGEKLKAWIDACPNPLYSALCYQGGAAWRARLSADLKSDAEAAALVARRGDEDLADLMANLGGQCLETLVSAFDAVKGDRPTVFLAYTVKGWSTPLAGHKDNHAGLMTDEQMDAFRASVGVEKGREWEPFCAIGAMKGMREFLSEVPFFKAGTRRHPAAKVAAPGPVFLAERHISTQAAFGRILDELATGGAAVAERIVTTSPDVTVSTNLGPWVNRRGLFDRMREDDTFRREHVPSMQKWAFSPEGQHIELGISENNLFLLLGAAGLAHSLFGERLIPIGTVYDPFISRGLDALNYACYQDARFLIVGTPSGVTLAPEGGAHQSIAEPLIGISQDRLAAFEPAFADELAVVMDWAFDYLQRSGEGDPDERTWLRDETGGSVYLRLSTRPLEQPTRRTDDDFRRGVIDGAYWLRKPGPNADVVLVYQGCVAPEVIAAAGRIGESRRDVGVLAVTSADRLNAGWTAAQRARRRGVSGARGHIETLLEDLPPHCTLVTVIDGHPATLAWLGAVAGHRTVPLGVEHFGQSASISDLYAHYGIDTNGIVRTVAGLTRGREINDLLLPPAPVA